MPLPKLIAHYIPGLQPYLKLVFYGQVLFIIQYIALVIAAILMPVKSENNTQQNHNSDYPHMKQAGIFHNQLDSLREESLHASSYKTGMPGQLMQGLSMIYILFIAVSVLLYHANIFFGEFDDVYIAKDFNPAYVIIAKYILPVLWFLLLAGGLIVMSDKRMRKQGLTAFFSALICNPYFYFKMLQFRFF